MGFENHPVTVFWMYKPKEYYGYNIYIYLSLFHKSYVCQLGDFVQGKGIAENGNLMMLSHVITIFPIIFGNFSEYPIIKYRHWSETEKKRNHSHGWL